MSINLSRVECSSITFSKSLILDRRGDGICAIAECLPPDLTFTESFLKILRALGDLRFEDFGDYITSGSIAGI